MSYPSILNCGRLSCDCLRYLLCNQPDTLTEEERYKHLVDRELVNVVSGYKLSDSKFIRNQDGAPYCMYCLQIIDNHQYTLITCVKCHYYVGHYSCFRKWKEERNILCLACGSAE